MGFRHLLAVLGVVSLSACSSTGGSDFQGVYAPSVVRIGEDGSFASRAAVWSSQDLAIAAAAARQRLADRAQEQGYDYFTLETVRSFIFFGQQVLMSGRLYRAGDAPEYAAPVVALTSTQPLELASAAAARPEPAPVRKPYRAVKPVEQRAAPLPAVVDEEVVDVPVEPVKANTDAPVVIEAPDFVAEDGTVVEPVVEAVVEPVAGAVEEPVAGAVDETLKRPVKKPVN